MPDRPTGDSFATSSPPELQADERRRILACIREQESPEHVGPFRIVEVLGRGGMGVVYRAEQSEPIRRMVAVKLIKLGFDTREVLARFHAERQVLARLEHPNIAHVLEAGITDDGRPYFVMEFVPGEPITAFADRHKLPVRARLDLFLQVCGAIAHAHTKAILHRDIKPSNLLAYVRDGKPVAMTIDFGIAKALADDGLSDDPQLTELGHAVGTLDYMSPEQARGSPDVDTRSDVYALGVVLYELLSGLRPFDRTARPRASSAAETVVMDDRAPPRPSTRLTEPGPHTDGIADARHTRLDRLARLLRDELEWIPLKAMRREPERRYGSVHELAADIQNYLDGRPLAAGPETRSYRLRKWIGRHRRSVAAALAVLLALLAGVVTTTHESIAARRAEAAARHAEARARDQQHLAEQRYADIRKIGGTFLFNVHDLLQNLPGADPARALLVRTAVEYLDKLAAEAGDDPALLNDLADAYDRLGNIQGNPNFASLGDADGAMTSYRTSLALRRRLAVAQPANPAARRDVAIAHERVGDMLATAGDDAAAMENYQTAVQILSVMAADDAGPDEIVRRGLAINYANIGDLRAARGERDAAMDDYRRSLEVRRQLAHDRPDSALAQRDLSVGYNKIGDLLAVSGDIPGALENYQEALVVRRMLADAGAKNVAVMRDLSVQYNRIGEVMATAGDVQAALENYTRALRIRERLADAHPEHATLQRDLLYSFVKMGDVLSQTADEHTRSPDQRVVLLRQARSWYIRCTENLGALKTRRISSPAQAKLADELVLKLASCDAAIDAAITELREGSRSLKDRLSRTPPPTTAPSP